MDYTKNTCKELLGLCKEKGLSNYSCLNKQGLIDLLSREEATGKIDLPKPVEEMKKVMNSDDEINMEGPWNHILQVIKYTNQDSLEVSADTMKDCKKSWKGGANQFEPRLLAYQTSAAARPDIFKKLGLCILPIRNGTYLLTKKNIYKSLDYKASHPISIPRNKESFILTIGNSETSLIDNLRYSGVFERPEILNEPILFGPLLNGRHRMDMSMKLQGLDVRIQGVQYEVDSCFETKNKILIIEGKSGTKPIDSFNIRQLYFPYRAVKSVINEKKEIVCAFLHQLGKNIHIWTYTFEDPSEMLSIKETGHFVFAFNS